MLLMIVVASFDSIKSETFFNLQQNKKKYTQREQQKFYEHNPLTNINFRGCTITQTHFLATCLFPNFEIVTWNRMRRTKFKRQIVFHFELLQQLIDGLRNVFFLRPSCWPK